jgi:hypothetical protein
MGMLLLDEETPGFPEVYQRFFGVRVGVFFWGNPPSRSRV